MLDQIPLQFDEEGIKEREDGERVGGGGGGAIILNIFIKGGRLIEGRLLFENIRYLSVILCGFRKEQILSIIPDHPGGGGGGGEGGRDLIIAILNQAGQYLDYGLNLEHS